MIKQQKKWIWLVLVLGLFVLACGFGSQAADAVDEAQVTAEAAAQEAEKEAQEAAKEVEKSAEEMAKEAEKAKEAVEDETQAAGEMEEVELNAESIRTTLQTLSSYRWQFNLSFDGVDNQGQSAQGQVEMLIESIKDPLAMHLRMQIEGQPAEELGGPIVVEMYNVDDVAYMQNPDDGSWFSFPAEGGMTDFFEAGFFDPDEIIKLPDNAQRSSLPEEVNGISTWHYTFDEADVDDENFTLDEAKGEIWVAREGGYPVKLVIEASGTSTNPELEDQLFSSGTINMTYELLDVNADFTIEVPEEALSAESFEGSLFDSTDTSEIDLPIMEDAEVEFALEGLVSYTIQGNIADVVEFYKAELPQQGWSLQADSEVVSEETALMTFTKEDEELSLVVSKEEDGSLSVVLSTEGQ